MKLKEKNFSTLSEKKVIMLEERLSYLYFFINNDTIELSEEYTAKIVE